MRNLKTEEKPLVSWLLLMAGRSEAVDELMVAEMLDARMGSLRFHSQSAERHFNGTVSEGEFSDADGVLVIAALHVDTQGHLYELDVWRTDFQSLQRWPEVHQITRSSSSSFRRTASGSR